MLYRDQHITLAIALYDFASAIYVRSTFFVHFISSHSCFNCRTRCLLTRNAAGRTSVKIITVGQPNSSVYALTRFGRVGELATIASPDALVQLGHRGFAGGRACHQIPEPYAGSRRTPGPRGLTPHTEMRDAPGRPVTPRRASSHVRDETLARIRGTGKTGHKRDIAACFHRP